jgi:NAD(P)-dependent dehydrogenase (short-subunit alcohol dehydrogenase family)
VVRELLRRGHRVLAVARPRSGIRGKNSQEDVVADLAPARVVFSDVTEPFFHSGMDGLAGQMDTVHEAALLMWPSR